MGQVYSHLSEEERQVVRIGMGNGASVRRMAMVPGRHASTVGREIRRDTWLPSSESESCRPCRPRRLKTGPWTGRCHMAGPARRKAMRRKAVARRPRRLAAGRLWAWVAERPHPVAHVDLRTPMRAGRREPFRRVGGRRRHRRGAAACTPRSSGAPVSPWPRIVPDETAAASVAAQEAMFSRLPAAARTGATHDDGTEFARHAGLRDEPGMATYFADPYS